MSLFDDPDTETSVASTTAGTPLAELAARFFGDRHHVFDFLDARKYRAERDKACFRRFRDQPRKRRLSGSWRTPQNDGLQPVAFDGFTKRLARRQDGFLADKLVEGGRPILKHLGSPGSSQSMRPIRRVAPASPARVTWFAARLVLALEAARYGLSQA